MAVHVVIPWRSGCPYREAALDYVGKWWMENYPTWSLTLGPWPVELGPWRKGCAVRAAGIHPAPDDVVVVSDADVIPVGIGEAVDAIGASGWGRPMARWAVPFRVVNRLSEAASDLVTSGRMGIPSSGAAPGILAESYVGTAGGGVVALRGDVFTDVPIDPRFAGYGQEDVSWSLALHRLAGMPAQGSAPLWHLWHTPQERMIRGTTVSRGVGSVASQRLWQRYREAATPTLMRSLVAEAESELAEMMGDVGARTHRG